MLDVLYNAIAQVMLGAHSILSPVFGRDSGTTWTLSIVLLVVFVRLLLFPLFVRQIRTQRAMQALQPRVKELQAKHGNDRETLGRETMALYKEHKASPIGCGLPILLQIPVFYALFRVLDGIKPRLVDGNYVFPTTEKYGISPDLLESAARAKVFGAPIAAAFDSPPGLVEFLSASQTAVKILAVLLIIAMGASTFITQKQLMARNGPVDPQQAQIQKILLYFLPFSFAFFSWHFPLGVLIYWCTTNLWSMGQQAFVIRRIPPRAPGAVVGASGTGDAGGGTRGKSNGKSARPAAPTGTKSLAARKGGQPGKAAGQPGKGSGQLAKRAGQAGKAGQPGKGSTSLEKGPRGVTGATGGSAAGDGQRPAGSGGSAGSGGKAAAGSAAGSGRAGGDGAGEPPPTPAPRPAVAAAGARRPGGGSKRKNPRRGGRR